MSIRTSAEPINPAPPVTKTVFILGTDGRTQGFVQRGVVEMTDGSSVAHSGTLCLVLDSASRIPPAYGVVSDDVFFLALRGPFAVSGRHTGAPRPAVADA